MIEKLHQANREKKLAIIQRDILTGIQSGRIHTRSSVLKGVEASAVKPQASTKR